MDAKCDVHSVYTDFKKAFDVVPFNLLLYKMQYRFGIANNELQWFKSYLYNRYLRVVLHGIESAWVEVTSGVPEGSILGPSLFLMYIDDLPLECANSESLLFADDNKIFRVISCLADCFKLQCDLDNVYEWCIQWKLNLHFDKCFSICFSNRRKNKILFTYKFGTQVMESIDNIKDLGIYFSSNFTFKYHIEHTVSQALKMLGFINRTCKAFDDKSVLISLYKSLVRY